MQKFHNGFSLIEMLVIVTIISIISTFSLSIYSHHVARENRLEAIMILTQLATALEKYYFANNTYSNASLTTLGFAEKIVHNRYQLTIASATNHQFIIEAIPQTAQAKIDVVCGTLILTSHNEKKISGTGNIAECYEAK